MKIKIIMLVIVSIILSFFAGIWSEFEWKLTQKAPFEFTKRHYRTLANVDVAEKFINRSKEAIQNWNIYHSTGDDQVSKRNSVINMGPAMKLYALVNVSDLPISWKVHVNYFYAHIQLLCADLENSTECLNNAIRILVNTKNLYEDSTLDAETRKWIRTAGIEQNINILSAFAFALQHRLQPDDAAKIKTAIAALELVGDKNYLMEQNVQKDRLLGPIFRFAYPEEASLF